MRLHPTSGGRAKHHTSPGDPSSPLSPARSNALAPRHRRCVRRPGRARPDALRRDHDAEARPDRPGQPAGQVHHGLVPQGVHRRLARAAGRRLQRHDARLARGPRAPGRQLQRVRRERRQPVPVRRRPCAATPPRPAILRRAILPTAPPARPLARPRPPTPARPRPRPPALAGTRASATSRAPRATPSARRRSRARASSSSATWRSSPSCRACARARRPTWSSTTSTSPR